MEPDVASDGVDLGLIRWMLSLSPLERLDALQDFVDGALALRDGRVQIGSSDSLDLPTLIEVKERVGRDKNRSPEEP